MQKKIDHKLEQLEPRLLLSADGMVDILPAPDTTHGFEHALEQDLNSIELSSQNDNLYSSDGCDKGVESLGLLNTASILEFEEIDEDLFSAGPDDVEPEEDVSPTSENDSQNEEEVELYFDTSSEYEYSNTEIQTSYNNDNVYSNTDELVDTLHAANAPPTGQREAYEFVYYASPGTNELTLRLNPSDISSIELIDTLSDNIKLAMPISEVLKVEIFGTDKGDDLLVIDFSTPFWIENGIEYNGGKGACDSLILLGNASLQNNYTANGTIELSSDDYSSLVSFTGLETNSFNTIVPHEFGHVDALDGLVAIVVGTSNIQTLGTELTVADEGSGEIVLDQAAADLLNNFDTVTIGGSEAGNVVTIEDDLVTFENDLIISNPDVGGEVFIRGDVILSGGDLTIIGSGHTTTFGNGLVTNDGTGSSNPSATTLNSAASVNGDLTTITVGGNLLIQDAVEINGKVKIVAYNITIELPGTIMGNNDGTDDELTLDATGRIWAVKNPINYQLFFHTFIFLIRCKS